MNYWRTQLASVGRGAFGVDANAKHALGHAATGAASAPLDNLLADAGRVVRAVRRQRLPPRHEHAQDRNLNRREIKRKAGGGGASETGCEAGCVKWALKPRFEGGRVNCCWARVDSSCFRELVSCVFVRTKSPQSRNLLADQHRQARSAKVP